MEIGIGKRRLWNGGVRCFGKWAIALETEILFQVNINKISNGNGANSVNRMLVAIRCHNFNWKRTISLNPFGRRFCFLFFILFKSQTTEHLHLSGLSACCHQRMTNLNCVLLSIGSMCHLAVDTLEIHFRCTGSMIGMHVSFCIHFTWQTTCT